MPAGYSGTPLPKKLGIKPGHRVGVIRAPEHLDALLEGLPSGARRLQFRSTSPHYDVIMLFARDRRTLAREWTRAVGRLDIDGGLWVAWPKKTSALHVDLGDSGVRALGLAGGLVDNKVCAIDEDWSGLRFVYRVADRPALRAQREADS